MEKLYYTSLLESCTEDQWHADEALYVTFDEYVILKKVIEILILKRHGIQAAKD